MNRIKEAFDTVRADDALKDKTASFVYGEAAKRRKKPVFRLRYAAVAAIMLVGILSFGGISAYAMPASYISIDVNPSIELSVNRFDRVVAAKAYNDDGAAILEGIDLKGETYVDAINALLSDPAFQAYLDADAMLTFTVVSKNQEKIIADIEACEGYLQYGAQCGGASEDIVAAAHQNGLSFGKYQLYLDLAEYDGAITPGQCGMMTMKELHDLLRTYAGGEQNGNGQNGGGSGAGAQNGVQNTPGDGWGGAQNGRQQETLPGNTENPKSTDAGEQNGQGNAAGSGDRQENRPDGTDQSGFGLNGQDDSGDGNGYHGSF